MAFDAGAIVGEIVLRKDKWDQAVRGVQHDVETLGQKTSRLGQEFVASSRELTRFGTRLSLIGAATITPMVLLMKQAAQQNAVLADKFNTLSDAVGPFRDELVNYLVPWLERLIRLAQDLSEKFQNLSPPIKQFGVDTLVLASALFIVGGIAIKIAAAFEFLQGIVLDLLGAFISFAAANPMFVAGLAIITVLALVGKAMMQTEEGTRQLMTVINTLAQMFDLVSTTIAAGLLHLFDALLFIDEHRPDFGLKYLKDEKENVRKLREELDQLAKGSLVAVQESFDKLMLAASGQGTAAQDMVQKLKDDYAEIIKMLGGLSSAGGAGPKRTGPNPADQFFAGWKNGIRDLVKEFSDFGAMATTMAKRMADMMSRTFSDGFFDIMTGQFSKLGDVVTNFRETVLRIFADIFAQLLTYYAIIIPLSAALGVPPQALGAGLGGLNAMSGHADGISDVPTTGLYKLHSGETVVPRYDAQADRGAQKIEIHNLITSDAVALAMSGKEGRGVIVNIINEDSLRNGVIRREVSRR